MTIYVAIGNSDDKLTQAQWSEFIRKVNARVDYWSDTMYGAFFSLPDSPRQSATWSIDIEADDQEGRAALMTELQGFAAEFQQDAIAWTEGESKLIAPVEALQPLLGVVPPLEEE